MNSISAESRTPNHVMQTSLRRPSRAGIVVRLASLAIAGLTSAPRVAHAQAVACAINGPANALIPAISATVTGDILSLAAGCVYVLNIANNTNVTLGDNGLPLINKRLTIKGNGAIIMRSAAAGTPNFRITEIAPGGDLTLDRVTLDNGNASGTQRAGRGGGIYNLGTLKIEHSILSNNVAAEGGGGIGNGDAQEDAPPNPAHAILMLSDDSTLSENTAAANGGAIANGFTSTMNLSDCTISDNKSGGGAGIGSQGTAILNKCTITGNSALIGGGIANAGHLFLTDSPVTGNNTTGTGSTGGFGGGIFNNAPGSLTLTHSDVTGNNATNDGGGIANVPNATTTLTDSDVTANSTTQDGAGIANAGHMTLTHSNVTGNNATHKGAGISNKQLSNSPIASLTLTHSDVTGNLAGDSDGGVFNQTGNRVTLNDSTVTGNTPDDF